MTFADLVIALVSIWLIGGPDRRQRRQLLKINQSIGGAMISFARRKPGVVTVIMIRPEKDCTTPFVIVTDGTDLPSGRDLKYREN